MLTLRPCSAYLRRFVASSYNGGTSCARSACSASPSIGSRTFRAFNARCSTKLCFPVFETRVYRNQPCALSRNVTVKCREPCIEPNREPCVAQATKASGKKPKRRLDVVCCELAPEYSKNVIQSFILDGKVYVDGRKVTKSGAQIGAAAVVEIRAEVPKYVCRAGLKLEKALEAFKIDVTGLTALDSGLSTGGFTDCLLQNGAVKVYGVDVGYGQVAERVRVDPRVVVMERTNLRALPPDALPCLVDIATLDLSFISVLKVMPAVVGVMKPDAQLVVLIKPQFEAGQANVAKGGVIRSDAVHQDVITRVTSGITELGFQYLGCIESPLRGAHGGNKEFLAHFRRSFTAKLSASEWVMKWTPPAAGKLEDLSVALETEA